MTIAHFAFNIPWYLSLVAIALSSVLSAVATRALGETDINPVGGMGKVTQLVFGVLAPGQMTTNLLAAAITGGGASQAADMMQDLKTGNLLGASPRKQMLAQLAGITMGIFLCVPAYELLTNAYPLGEDELPAPAAIAWKAMAELLAKGPGALPSHTGSAVIVASVVGAIIAALRRVGSIKAYVPSGLAMGIALIIPAYYSMTIFYGLAAWWVWKSINPTAADRYTYAAAAGLIAGEGLMGIVNAGLTVVGVNPLVK
jgi:OPT family oligopeptide transporter